ncbi:efflux RND transporter periplasmic adaptor subunit [Belliella sp. DSM 111904]|uniref:Efflux RND transporter periplasmic adaptor subunit n=1 Tax=Belliella filtrata TaxID=2923435 RepID=A0ABS9V3L1_9BACT|nr:efflux RND transporter periplasmic adaptor subunit [Belliella filtrata]MCH7410968.1 efflux RND transporter periplasmic adaptor subunit [Belliella filtrata]
MKLSKHTLLLFSVFLFVACNSSRNEKDAEQGRKVYETITIVSTDLQGSISLPAELKSFESVAIYAKAAGFVQQVKVDRGSKVKKGELLAQLDAPELVAKLAAAKAKVLQSEGLAQSVQSKLATIKDQLDRIQKTSQTPGTVSDADLRRVENQLKEEEAMVASSLSALEASRFELQAAEQMVSYLIIRSPFEGIVTERNIHTGTFVNHQSSGKPLFQLEMNNVLRLEIPLPEAYSGYDLSRDSVKFTLNAQPGEEFKAMVSRQSGSLQNASRTEIIEADVPNESGKLKAGSFSQVKIPYFKPNVIMVPSSSVVTSMEDRFVVKIENGAAKRVSIKKGITQDGKVEVFGRINIGDKILKNPSDTIQDGDEIHIEN